MLAAAVPSADLSVSTRFGIARSRSFDEVREEVARRAGLAVRNVTVAASALRMSEVGTIDVPHVGSFALTEWSKSQLSRELGIRWERWFQDELVSPTQRAEEINRRLARSSTSWVVRLRRHAADEPGAGDGVLRGFVGTHYLPIDDERVFDRLTWALGTRTQVLRFARAEETDRTSQYLAITEEDVDLGAEKPDPHRNGFLIRNSEVGGASLWIIEYLFRLICANGLTVAISGRPVFRKPHRGSDPNRLDRDLSYALAQLPSRWERGQALLRAARLEHLEKPEEFLRNALADEPGARTRVAAVLAAFRMEPDHTLFGAIQSITRAAQDFGPEGRFELEQLAGRLLAAGTSS